MYYRNYQPMLMKIASVILQIVILVPLFYLPLNWWQFFLLIAGVELACTFLWFLEPFVGAGILVWSCIHVVNNVTGFWKVFYFIFFSIDCILILIVLICLIYMLVPKSYYR